MAELVVALMRTKLDVVNTLKMKSMLWSKGVGLSGMVLEENDVGTIPPSLLEDMIQLRIMGHLNQ